MLEERKNRSMAMLLGCVWMIMLGVVSFLPNRDKLLLHTTGHYHIWGHMLAFFIVTLLLAGSATSLRSRFALAAAVAFFGYLLEYFEHVIYNGALERSDVLIDTLGVIFGLVVVLAHEEFKRIRSVD